MKLVKKLALQQLLVGVLGAVIWMVFDDIGSGFPALCGGGIAATLTFYAGLKTFGRHSDDPTLVVANFYRAQMRKFALAVVMFGVAVQIFGNNFAPLITTFSAALSIYWLALIWDP